MRFGEPMHKHRWGPKVYVAPYTMRPWLRAVYKTCIRCGRRKGKFEGDWFWNLVEAE